jgi:hypothetical protein
MRSQPINPSARRRHLLSKPILINEGLAASDVPSATLHVVGRTHVRQGHGIVTLVIIARFFWSLAV